MKRCGLFVLGCLAPIFLVGNVANAQIPVQIIHNSPAMGTAMVDIYIDDNLIADDFPFKSATPFVDGGGNPVILVGPTSKVDIVDASAPDNTSPIHTENLLLTMGMATLLEFVGMPSVTNPDGIDTGFDVLVYEGYKPAADDPATAEMMAVHGAPDAPAVDLVVRTTGPGMGVVIFSNLAYKQTQPHVVLSPDDVILDVVETGTTNVLQSFDASFGLVQGAGVVGNAGGLLSDGSLTLFGAVATGFVFELDVVVGVNEPTDVTSFLLGRAFPNPFHPRATIPFSLETGQQITLRTYDMRGRLVSTLVDEVLPAGTYEIPFASNGLASGTYVYELRTAEGVERKTMTLIK